MSDDYPLALVTGAARRLGKEIAVGLAHMGYAIGLHYYHSSYEVQALYDELQTVGIPAILLKADLRDPLQVGELFDHVRLSPYPLKVLINSAAVIQRQDLLSLSVDEWESTLSLNLRAPWLCAREAARLMRSQGGVIINITDSGAHKAWVDHASYVLSKSALETLTRLLARSLAPEIRVNAVAPGLILPAAGQEEGEWQRLVQRLPLQRSGDIQDVVRAVIFLIQNEYITGQTLVVDGGYQLV